MKHLAVVFICLYICIPTALSAQSTKGPFYYLSPAPGAERVHATTTLIFRPRDALVLKAPDWTRNVEVRGTASGQHAGRWIRSRDGRTFIFRPSQPFSLGERVDVTLAGIRGGAFSSSFRIASEPPIPDRNDASVLCDCASGPQAVSRRPTIDTGNFPRRQTTADGFVLPPDFPQIQEAASGTPSPGYTFISNFGWPPFTPGPNEPGRYMMILDNIGEPVFFRRCADVFIADFKVLAPGLISYYSYPREWFFLMDDTYTVVDSVTTIDYGVDFHDIVLLPNGNFILFGHDNQPRDMSEIVDGGDPNAEVVEIVIQEIDPDGNVVFQWRSVDNFDLLDAPHYDYTVSRVDYIHPNSLDIDEDGSILLSSRHLDEVTKISRDTGEMVWRLGGNHNEFAMQGAGQWFTYQHSARRLTDGNLILYDNGNWNNPKESRAVEYALDEENMTVSQVWEYRNTPAQFSSAMGSVQRLANGNTFIGWGSSTPNATEVRPDGSKVMEIAFEGGLVSYRAFHFGWEGKAAVPFLWVEGDSNTAALHFTRFGDNAVAGYNIYQGATPKASTRIGSTGGHRFDVTDLHPGTTYFRVTAVDPLGEESGYSNVDSVEVDVRIVSATATVTPRTLNRKSRGKWITARIEMGEDCGCDAHDIDIASLRVQDVVPAASWPVSFCDTDDDGIEEVKVKFPRQDVAALLETGDHVPVEISGFAGGNYFVAVAYVRVIDPSCAPVSSLGPNTPNPFNPSTMIPYTIVAPGGRTRVVIYDAAGRRIQTLVDGTRTPGAYTAVWDGRDRHGSQVASGIYFVRLESSGVSETRKIVLLK